MTTSSESSSPLKSTTSLEQNDNDTREIEFDFEMCHSSYCEYYGYSGYCGC